MNNKLIEEYRTKLEETEVLENKLIKELQKKFDLNENINAIGKFYKDEGDETIYVEILHWGKSERYPIESLIDVTEKITRTFLDNIEGSRVLYQ